jgi:DNA-binding CsgD family transcriptional regulator
MGNLELQISPREPVEHASNLVEIENGLRGMLDAYNHSLQPVLFQETTPHVLIDLHVNGFRYTLICSQASEIALSPREREIVQLVAKGLPNKTIAMVLDISPCTVATHLRRVFVKLGVSSRAEMVAVLGHGFYP